MAHFNCDAPFEFLGQLTIRSIYYFQKDVDILRKSAKQATFSSSCSSAHKLCILRSLKVTALVWYKTLPFKQNIKHVHFYP